MLRRALDRKSGKYGNPEKPIVVAALVVSSFAKNEVIEEALFGSVAVRFDPDQPGGEHWIRKRDGFWMSGYQPRGTRVSAVMTGAGLMPGNAARVWPRSWLNPWATNPLKVDLPFPHAIGNEQGAVEYEEASGSPGSIFGLRRAGPIHLAKSSDSARSPLLSVEYVAQSVLPHMRAAQRLPTTARVM